MRIAAVAWTSFPFHLCSEVSPDDTLEVATFIPKALLHLDLPFNRPHYFSSPDTMYYFICASSAFSYTTKILLATGLISSVILV